MRLSGFLFVLILLVGCGQRKESIVLPAEESEEAKALLQGIWKDSDTENVIFRVQGDTVFYPDTVSQPAYFRIVNDTLTMGRSNYHIVKQSEYVFWFRNQSNDVIKLYKSKEPSDTLAFAPRRSHSLPLADRVLKNDSVVYFNNNRYHWYIAVNPTKYLVLKKTYGHDGVETEMKYYDNIIHISIYQGDREIFSSDFKKQMFSAYVPESFLLNAILEDIKFSRVDSDGFHFNATISEPDAASCYLVSADIDFEGRIRMELLEY